MRLRRPHTVLMTVLFGSILPSNSIASSNVNSTFVPQSGSMPALTLSLDHVGTLSIGEQFNPSLSASLSSPSSVSASPSSSALLTSASRSSDAFSSRSDDDSSGGRSIFKSIKKPIKSIFKSWFEPSTDALLPDSTSSTYFFAPSSQKNPLKTIVPKASKTYTTGAGSVMLSPAPVARYRPNLHGHPGATAAASSVSYRLSQARRAASPTYAIGDPENGRGMTFSFDNGEDKSQQAQQAYSTQAVQSVVDSQPQQSEPQPQQAEQSPSPGGLSFSLGGNRGADSGGGRGLSLSFGGNGGGITAGGGRGLSFSMGGNGGGGGGGRGLSLSLGGGNGISLGFGGNGGGGETVAAGSEPQAYEHGAGSSNSYAYSGGQGGASYPAAAGGYGQQSAAGYGGKSNYNYDYYPNKPKFSITMPSPGKTVVEANYRPPTIKMKVNASPKVKITTGTRDPLEKPEEEEIITDDIFGEPAPFPKPDNKTKTDGMNGTMGAMFNSTHPFPYMPYYPMAMPPVHPAQMYAYYQQYYPQYYQYYQSQFAALSNNHSAGSPQHEEEQAPKYGGGQQYSGDYGKYGAGNSPSYGNSYSGKDYSKDYKYPNPYKHDPIAIASQMHLFKTMPTQTMKTVPMSISRSMGGAPRPTMLRANRRLPLTKPLSSFRRMPSSSAVRPVSPYSPSTLYPSYARPSVSTARSPNRALLLRSNKRSSTPFMPKDSLTAMGSAQMMSYAKPHKMNMYQARSPNNQNNNNQHNRQSKHYEMAPSESKSYYQFHSSDAKGKTPGVLSQQPQQHHQQQQSVGQWPMSGSAHYPQYHHYPMAGNGTDQGAYSDYYQQLYSNPAYYSYYQQYYQYAKQYYEHYYANQTNNKDQTDHNGNVNGTQNSNNTNSTSAAAERIKYAPYSKQLLSGFNQNNLDWHQSKKFGSRVEKYNGGTTKEEKSKIVLDIRPRLTIRMLNRTQAEEEQKKLHKNKEKEHIFNTKLTILMETTTTAKPSVKPSNYYKYNYYDDENVDEFGYTKAPHTPEPPTTVRPKTSTTRRRTTTTEEPSSTEEDDESSSSESSTEDSSTKTSTTTTTEASASDDDSSKEDVEDEEDNKSSTTTSTTTTTTTTEKVEDVIDESDEMEKKPEAMASKDKKTDSEEDDESDSSTKSTEQTGDKGKNKMEIDSAAHKNGVTASPELVAAMVKALQEAFSNNPAFIATTPAPPVSTESEKNAGKEDSDSAETTDVDENNNNSADKSKNQDKDCPDPPKKESGEEMPSTEKSSSSQEDEEIDGGRDGGTSAQAGSDDDEDMEMKPTRSKLIPTVFSAVVTNTTQLRLKTPVVTMQSRKNRPQALALSTSGKHSGGGSSGKNSGAKSSRNQMVNVKKAGLGSSGNSKKNKKLHSNTLSMSASNSRVVVTTTSPFRSGRAGSKSKSSKSKKSQLPKVIDGDAVLKAGSAANHNINIEEMSDDERKDMLTNILQIVQARQLSNELQPEPETIGTRKRSKSSKSTSGSSSAKSKSGAKLLPVTKANNVRIISSLDELKQDRRSGESVDPTNQPVYVVLMPQNKRKK